MTQKLHTNENWSVEDSAAQLAEDLVDAYSGPHGDGFWGAPLGCPARRNDSTGADQSFEVGCVCVERA